MTALHAPIGRYADLLDEARDMADFDEPRLSHAEILARNERWSFYRAERERKGRAGYVRQAEYRDGRVARIVRTNAPDPILDLYVARKAALRPSVAGVEAWHWANVRYGALLAEVMSPATLPDVPTCFRLEDAA